VNIGGFLLGSSSYINVNWLHKWVSRTLFVTVTVHGSFFIREWVRADFFRLELEMMPMVKYGLGLWAVLGWTMLSSLVPLRRLCYEVFVLQHIISAAIFLWLLYKHIPAYAAYNVWMAVAFVLLGRAYRLGVLLYRNFNARSTESGGVLVGGWLVGYPMQIQALAGQITKVAICDINFRWETGQHILLWCPQLSVFGSHPFTISNIPNMSKNTPGKIELTIRARFGFTRKLHRRAIASHPDPSTTTTAFITGPFGSLPAWNTFETLVLISASTGASFTLPILESVLRNPCCVSRTDCYFLIRDETHLDAYISRIRAAAFHPRAAEMDLRIVIAVTTAGEHGKKKKKKEWFADPDTTPPFPTIINYLPHRPHLASAIRDPVEASGGETCVVACGGTSLTSDVRNAVFKLADERAVHKGTGAQGIRLHVEGFGSS